MKNLSAPIKINPILLSFNYLTNLFPVINASNEDCITIAGEKGYIQLNLADFHYRILSLLRNNDNNLHQVVNESTGTTEYALPDYIVTELENFIEKNTIKE